MNSRRDFLKKGAVALAGSMLISKTMLAGSKSAELTGLQLYSIREDMKKDPLGSLKQLASMGYKNVEHANYVDRKFYGYTAKEFRKILDDLGLKMPSGHTVMRKEHWDETTKDFSTSWKQTIEDAAIVGQQFVISPSLDQSMQNHSF